MKPKSIRPLGRRSFLELGAVGLAALAGCGAESVTDEGGPPVRVEDDPVVRINPTCGGLTEANIEGPYFTPSSPLRRSLLEPGTAGAVWRLTGRVLTRQCVPIVGAMLDFWHADDVGD